jgi:hypothetical protein
MTKYTNRDQAELMRDIISMYRNYSSDSNIIEYLSSLSFSISRIIDDNNLADRNLRWNELFNILDSKYHNLKNKSSTVNNDELLEVLYKNSLDIVNQEII